MNVLPFQRRQLSGAESGEKADGNGCQQRRHSSSTAHAARSFRA
jgi:hypothetical protein